MRYQIKDLLWLMLVVATGFSMYRHGCIRGRMDAPGVVEGYYNIPVYTDGKHVGGYGIELNCESPREREILIYHGRLGGPTMHGAGILNGP